MNSITQKMKTCVIIERNRIRSVEHDSCMAPYARFRLLTYFDSHAFSNVSIIEKVIKQFMKLL